MAIFIKYEFWRNYIDVLHRKGIPVYSVSSIFRPGQIFFQWYGRSYARCLRRIHHFFVQNRLSVKLLARIGVTDNVTVTGDTRFDRVIDIRRAARPLPLVERFAQGHTVLVAGSTWAPDEEILLDYVNRREDLRLVIAPHVVSAGHLKEIESRITRRCVRYSEPTEETVADFDVLIVDSYGLLSSIYRYGSIAYVAAVSAWASQRARGRCLRRARHHRPEQQEVHRSPSPVGQRRLPRNHIGRRL